MVCVVHEREDEQRQTPGVYRVQDELSSLRISGNTAHPSECPPNVEAHDVQPEKSTQEAHIGRVSGGYTPVGHLDIPESQMNNRHCRIGDGEARNVAHKVLAVHISQLWY